MGGQEESGEWGIDHGSLSPTCKSICDLTIHVIHYPSIGRITIAVGCELQAITLLFEFFSTFEGFYNSRKHREDVFFFLPLGT